MARLHGLLFVLCTCLAATLAAQASEGSNSRNTADVPEQVVVDGLFSVSLNKRLEGVQVLYRLDVEANPLVLGERTSIVAHIRNSEGFTGLQPLPRVGDNRWQLDYRPEQRGRYAIHLRVSGQHRNDGAFTQVLPSHYFVYPDTDDPDSDPELEALQVHYQEQLAAAELRAVERQTAQPQALPEPMVDDEPANAVKSTVSEEPVFPATSQRRWPIYLAVILVNLLLLGVAAFVFYRMMRKPQEVQPEEADLEVQEPVQTNLLMQEISADERRTPEFVPDVFQEEQPAVNAPLGEIEDHTPLFPLNDDDPDEPPRS